MSLLGAAPSVGWGKKDRGRLRTKSNPEETKTYIYLEQRHIPNLSFVASLLTEYKCLFDISLEKSESMELFIYIYFGGILILLGHFKNKNKKLFSQQILIFLYGKSHFIIMLPV